MPWTDGSPVQNVPSTPLLGHARRTADTPVALVPEYIDSFDSPGFDVRVPGTPVASTQNQTTVSIRNKCGHPNSTPEVCSCCFRNKTPNIATSRRRNLSREICFSSPRTSRRDPMASLKEQVVPGTPSSPHDGRTLVSPYHPALRPDQRTPKAHYNRTPVQQPRTPNNMIATPSVQKKMSCTRPQRTITPPLTELRNKAAINLFKGDDIFG